MQQDETYFSIPREKIMEYLSTARIELNLCKELIRDYMKSKGENRWLVSCLCEVYSSNYRMLSELTTMVEYGSDKENNVVLMTKEEIALVEAIVVAKYYSSRDLNMFAGISFSIN